VSVSTVRNYLAEIIRKDISSAHDLKTIAKLLNKLVRNWMATVIDKMYNVNLNAGAGADAGAGVDAAPCTYAYAYVV